MILPHKHKLTRLIVENEHKRLLHAGCQAVLSSLRQKFWSISGKSLVRLVIHNCIKCFRANPKTLNYKMGDLPTARVQQDFPFSTCGVDFAGPFNIKEGKTRGRKIVKAYVCLFVCFATKAVHLELAENLSTEAFLNFLRRFVSRRGRCHNIHSDNGTNFVGAARQLKELQHLLRNLEKDPKIQSFLSSEMIKWHFIPPKAPNFGGLWERAIKSTKTHMTRILQEAYLTYEEFYTVLVQIEACLNSRPISPLSEDPNDMTALTPGHFLIGRSITLLPEHDLLHLKENRLSRYQRTQALFQHYWKRWHLEYLHNLQQNYKWKENKKSLLKIGSLVVIHEDDLPPLKWSMGRVIATHPGEDEITRVVTIKTATRELRRPTSKICVLPIEPLKSEN